MNLNERFDVSPAKVEELRARVQKLGIDLAAVEEGFSRGSGKGGQNRHKTSSRVTLRYKPMALVVHCAADRRRTVNRFLALRELVDRVEMKVSPSTSKRLQETLAIRRRKSRSAARTRDKYGAAGPSA